jgi:hypothetical protein
MRRIPTARRILRARILLAAFITTTSFTACGQDPRWIVSFTIHAESEDTPHAMPQNGTPSE